MTTLSAASPLSSALPLLLDGIVPEEFKDTEVFINMSTAPAWALPIFEQAVASLKDVLSGDILPTCKADNGDVYPFVKGSHNHPLTVEMHLNGWTQWQTTVSTRSREDCAAAGVKYRRFRYAIHCWVSPDRQHVVLPKLKVQGKHIPS